MGKHSRVKHDDQLKCKKVILLASGGLDSTACIAYYLHHDYVVEPVWVNYEQKAARMEKMAIHRVVQFYKLPLQVISLKGLKWSPTEDNVEYPGRNAIMALIGATSLQNEHGLISMGLHAGTNYVDCSDAFQAKIGGLITLLFHGRVAVDFPFATWNKADIVQFSIRYDVPIDLTYSCLQGTAPPCGICESCLERQSLLQYWSKK